MSLMRKYPLRFISWLLALFFFNSGEMFSQEAYRDHKALSTTLEQLHQQYPGLTSLKSIAITLGKKEIWALEIGHGERDNHPGIAVVGGVDGKYVSGPELALRFAEELLTSTTTDSIRNLIDSVTFYIIPNVNPDATEQHFASLKYNRQVNNRSTDDDRDGRLNEDPFEDINQDGYITSLRIKDPKGEWIVHPDDKRVMIRADKNDGEKGSYILITEGTDNDHDGIFNEDGPGGINFNQNLPYKFSHFKAGAGDYPVSEIESRAVLDFLYERWNIFAVFIFGPSDNLSMPQQYNKAEAEQQIVSSILEKDAVINSLVSKKYNDLTGKKDNAKVVTYEGGFMQWAYFHYGRLSFSTPAFYLPEIKIKPDTTRNNEHTKDTYNPELNFLHWADSVLKVPYFQEWTAIEHPDFKDREVEIGGIYPFVFHNPPAIILDSLARSHNRFIVWLASQRPVAEIVNLKTENLGKGLFRVEMDIYNKGIMPAMSEIGEKTRWVKKPRIRLELQQGQEIISGRSIQLLDTLPGDSAGHISWLVRGKGTLKVQAGAPQTGFQVIDIELK